jgi:hypothetical protein
MVIHGFAQYQNKLNNSNSDVSKNTNVNESIQLSQQELEQYNTIQIQLQIGILTFLSSIISTSYQYNQVHLPSLMKQTIDLKRYSLLIDAEQLIAYSTHSNIKLQYGIFHLLLCLLKCDVVSIKQEQSETQV